MKKYINLPRNTYFINDKINGLLFGYKQEKKHKELKINFQTKELILDLCSKATDEVITSYSRKYNISKIEIKDKIFNILNKINNCIPIKFCDFKPNVANIPISIGDLNLVFPRHASIEITDKCNIKCRFCYNNSNSNNKNFIKSPMKLLKILCDKKIKVIEITGGEPFLHPDFIKILEYCIENFEVVALITNGTNHNPLFFDLVEGKRNILVQVTIPGAKKESSYEEYIETKKNLCEDIFNKKIKFIKKLKKRDVRTRIVYIVDDPKKIDEMSNVVNFAKNIGGSSFTATLNIPNGRGKNREKSMSSEDYKKFAKHLNDLREQFPNFIENDNPEKLPVDLNKGWSCGAGSKSICITADQKLKPCVMFSSDMIHKNLELDRFENEIIDQISKFAFNTIDVPSFGTCLGCEFSDYCIGCLFRGIKKIPLKGKDKCGWYLKMTKKEKEIVERYLC
ncbi:MAG: hypothetical protein CSA15_11190 [Candidatus Delongbacteria bacterium]|nr:MAG: hypothetical protein CSA15_11190 [Candidatus Delongbacteria bacterium]